MVLSDPRYYRATYVGLLVAIFQQLTGINTIFMYSNTVFKGLGLQQTVITVMMGSVNMLASIVGFFLLFYYGRRTLLLGGSIVMTLCLLLLALFI